MAFGLQVETISGTQDITTLRSMRLIQSITLSGSSGSGTLPSGCTSSNSFPFIEITSGSVLPWVVFSGTSYTYDNRFGSSTSFTMHVMRFS
jgi:hypothetical protein